LVLLHLFFEFLDCLFVGVDEEVVIEFEGEGLAVDDSEVHRNVPLVTPHCVEDVQDFCSRLSDFDAFE
jgi:hypothetical protein